MKEPLKVVVTNVIAGNSGDAAIFLGMAKILKATISQDLDICSYGRLAEAIQPRYPDLSFKEMNTLSLGPVRRYLVWIAAFMIKVRLTWLAALFVRKQGLDQLLDYAASDLIISGGGTYLVPHYSMRNRVIDYKLSLFLGKRLVFFTQSLGPFLQSEYKDDLRQIFRKAMLVAVRDETSLKHLLELGIARDKIHVCADAAFALASDHERLASKVPSPSNPLKVAVSVREWEHFIKTDRQTAMTAYKSAVAELTQYLVEEHGAQVTFISTCQGIPGYRADDAKTADSIVQLLSSDTQAKVQVDTSFRRPEETMETVRGFDFVVATRMHMAILALNSGVPVLSIAYEFKAASLFERLGWSRFCLGIEDLHAEDLISACSALIENLDQIRAALPEKVETLRKESYSAGAELSKRWQM